MERSFETFALKFRSIKRNYRILYGEDPLVNLNISEERARFVCEQSLRNLRLRVVHMYVMHRFDRKRYLNFLLGHYTTVLIELTEVLRLTGVDVPRSFEDRVIAVEKGFGVDVSILRDLLNLEIRPKRLRERDIEHFHHGLFYLLDTIVHWVEDKWPMNS